VTESEKIWFLNLKPYRKKDTLKRLPQIWYLIKPNELEYANGKIYANVFAKESMMIIDAKSGAIIGWVIYLRFKKISDKARTILDVLMA